MQKTFSFGQKCFSFGPERLSLSFSKRISGPAAGDVSINLMIAKKIELRAEMSRKYVVEGAVHFPFFGRHLSLIARQIRIVPAAVSR